MRGRYYLKHMINHSVDNRNRNKALDENYKNAIKENAMKRLREDKGKTSENIEYLKSLTHDVYRHGRKYKYDCSLNDADIYKMLLELHDEDLFKAYFGKTFEEDNTQKNVILAIAGIVIFFFIVIGIFG